MVESKEERGEFRLLQLVLKDEVIGFREYEQQVRSLQLQLDELKLGMNSVNKSIYAIEERNSLYDLCPTYIGNIRILNGKCYVFLKDGGDSFENAMLKCDNFTQTHNISNTVGADKTIEVKTVLFPFRVGSIPVHHDTTEILPFCKNFNQWQQSLAALTSAFYLFRLKGIRIGGQNFCCPFVLQK